MTRLLLHSVLVPLVLLLPGAGMADEIENRMQLADLDRGRVLFGACRLCHTAGQGEAHRIGPNLYGIFGRVVGTQGDFEGYSRRFREAGFVWTPRLLYGWLEAPMQTYPDSTMLSAGIRDPQARADLIAYLMQVTAAGSE